MTSAATPTRLADSVPRARSGQDVRQRSTRRRNSTIAYALLAPSLVGVVVFLAIPVVVVVVLSFFRWNLLTSPTFVGIGNYLDMFRFEGAGHALYITVLYVVLNIPVQTVLALALAMLMNRKGRVTAVVRVLCVLPYLATPVAMAVVWQWIFDPATGLVNTLLGLVGIQGPQWLSSSFWALPVVAFANVWQYVGYNMLFFLAGLQAIPPTVYEAADVDGVSKWGQFLHVTLPLLRPTMLFVLVTTVIGSFQVFDTVYVMTKGGPGTSTTVMNQLIYQNGFVGFRLGVASALSVLLFVIILAVTITQFRYFRNRTTYEMT
jgi:multiple sugar transport system permease protein/sn-glycerol 3-phosphate transport system permease protein